MQKLKEMQIVYMDGRRTRQKPSSKYASKYEIFACVIVSAHGCENFTEEIEEYREQIYPNTISECVEQNKELFYFGAELDNTYLYNIAPLGFTNQSSSNPQDITSRYMKTNVLDKLFKSYWTEINKRINLQMHDPTIMKYNEFILELLFTENMELFYSMFLTRQTNEAYSTSNWKRYRQFIKDFNRQKHAGTIMPNRVSLNSELSFHNTPSTQYKSVESLEGLPHDTWSGVFLAITNIFDIKELFDITLFDNWHNINSLFDIEINSMLFDTIMIYITEWNKSGHGYITISDIKIMNFYTINMYHIVFIILDYIKQINETNKYTPCITESIDEFINYMCNNFILKMYINSFACRVSTFDNELLKEPSVLKKTATIQHSTRVSSVPFTRSVDALGIKTKYKKVRRRKTYKNPYKHNSTNIVYGQDLPAILSTKRIKRGIKRGRSNKTRKNKRTRRTKRRRNRTQRTQI